MSDINFIPATGSGCRPRLDPLPADARRCTALLDFVFRRYLPAHRFDLVLLAGHWAPADAGAARLMIDWLRTHGKKVVLVGPITEYETFHAKLLAIAEERHDPTLADRFVDPRIAVLDRRFAAIARAAGAGYISPHRIICPGRCRHFATPDVPFQFDRTHLTDEGSILMAREIAPILRNAMRQSN